MFSMKVLAVPLMPVTSGLSGPRADDCPEGGDSCIAATCLTSDTCVGSTCLTSDTCVGSTCLTSSTGGDPCGDAFTCMSSDTCTSGDSQCGDNTSCVDTVPIVVPAEDEPGTGEHGQLADYTGDARSSVHLELRDLHRQLDQVWPPRA